MKQIILILLTAGLLCSCFGFRNIRKSMENMIDQQQEMMKKKRTLRTVSEVKNVELAMEEKVNFTVDDFNKANREKNVPLYIYDQENEKAAYFIISPLDESTNNPFSNKITFYRMDKTLLCEVTYTLNTASIRLEYLRDTSEKGFLEINISYDVHDQFNQVYTHHMESDFFALPAFFEINLYQEFVFMEYNNLTKEYIFYNNDQYAAAQVTGSAPIRKNIFVDSQFFAEQKDTAFCFIATFVTLDFIDVLIAAINQQNQQNNSSINHNTNPSFNNNTGPSFNNNGSIDNNMNPMDNF